MSVQTAFPSVVNALLATLRASADLTGVRVFDGPEVDSSFPGDAIAVGHDGTDDGDVRAGSGRQTYQELGNRKQFEDGTVECFLWSWDGGTSLSARRARAFVLLSAVDTALRADVSLAGACIYSTLDSHETSYRQTTAGSAVVINFSVAYRART